MKAKQTRNKQEGWKQLIIRESKLHDSELRENKLRSEVLELSRKLTAAERECAELRAAKADLRDLLREILPSGGVL